MTSVKNGKKMERREDTREMPSHHCHTTELHLIDPTLGKAGHAGWLLESPFITCVRGYVQTNSRVYTALRVDIQSQTDCYDLDCILFQC